MIVTLLPPMAEQLVALHPPAATIAVPPAGGEAAPTIVTLPEAKVAVLILIARGVEGACRVLAGA